MEMGHLEFLGGLYLDNDEEPCIPELLIEATLLGGAKKFKEGPKAKAGIFVIAPAKIKYDGPKDAEELWESPDFRSRTPAKIGQSKVMRTRPIFHEWEIEFEINFDDEMLDEERLLEWAKAAGAQVGLGDWRPRHGRFLVKVVEGKNGKSVMSKKKRRMVAAES